MGKKLQKIAKNCKNLHFLAKMFKKVRFLTMFFLPPCAFDAKWTLRIANPKFKALRSPRDSLRRTPNGGNPKWFDRLTILSEVEGQIRIVKIQNSKRGGAGFGVGNFFVIILLQTPARLMRNRGF